MTPERTDPEVHIPVLLRPTIEMLQLAPGKIAVDCTVGFAGHSSEIADRISPGGTLIGLDRDIDALTASRAKLARFESSVNIMLKHAAFSHLTEVLKELGVPERGIDAILLDLGVSSYQLDSAPGFSFRRNDALDGRMNRTGDEPTIAELLNSATEAQISDVIWQYGEERFSRRIAAAIVARRRDAGPLMSTGELCKVVESAVPRAAWPKDIDVSTRTFMALRVWCNRELDELRTGLDAAIDALAKGGRIAVISFNSIEDRIVKQAFARRSGKLPGASGYSMAALAAPEPGAVPTIEIVNKKPIEADPEELKRNARSRSAKLRIAQKL